MITSCCHKIDIEKNCMIECFFKKVIRIKKSHSKKLFSFAGLHQRSLSSLMGFEPSGSPSVHITCTVDSMVHMMGLNKADGAQKLSQPYRTVIFLAGCLPYYILYVI